MPRLEYGTRGVPYKAKTIDTDCVDHAFNGALSLHHGLLETATLSLGLVSSDHTYGSSGSSVPLSSCFWLVVTEWGRHIGEWAEKAGLGLGLPRALPCTWNNPDRWHFLCCQEAWVARR